MSSMHNGHYFPTCLPHGAFLSALYPRSPPAHRPTPGRARKARSAFAHFTSSSTLSIPHPVQESTDDAWLTATARPHVVRSHTHFMNVQYNIFKPLRFSISDTRAFSPSASQL